MLHGLHHQLGNAVAVVDGLWLGRQVDENSINLATIIAVDGARRIESGNTLPDGQPAAGPHLRFVAL